MQQVVKEKFQPLPCKIVTQSTESLEIPSLLWFPQKKKIGFTLTPKKILEVKKEHVKVKHLVSHSELPTTVEQNSVSIKSKKTKVLLVTG